MKNTTLLIIDVQQGFNEPSWGNRNNPEAEKNIALLLSEWRKNDLPIIHVRHCSINPNSPLNINSSGSEFKPEAKPLPKEKQITKSVNSAFIGTDLEKYLNDNNIRDLVIVGLTTDHCVSTTTRMAGNLGFNVTLISDATATFERKSYNDLIYSAEDIHQINLTSLNNEFCQVVTTQYILKKISEFIHSA